MQSADGTQARESATAQPNFAYPHVTNGTRGRSEAVDEENAHERQSLKCSSRPFLYQLGRNHGEGREWLAVTMDVDSAERNQSLSSPALCDHRRAPCLSPALYHAHHRERLGRKRLSEELSGKRGGYIVKALQ